VGVHLFDLSCKSTRFGAPAEFVHPTGWDADATAASLPWYLTRWSSCTPRHEVGSPPVAVTDLSHAGRSNRSACRRRETCLTAGPS
jgi:hypothetical protein